MPDGPSAFHMSLSATQHPPQMLPTHCAGCLVMHPDMRAAAYDRHYGTAENGAPLLQAHWGARGALAFLVYSSWTSQMPGCRAPCRRNGHRP